MTQLLDYDLRFFETNALFFLQQTPRTRPIAVTSLVVPVELISYIEFLVDKLVNANLRQAKHASFTLSTGCDLGLVSPLYVATESVMNVITEEWSVDSPL